MRSLLLNVRGWHNFSWKMEPLAEVVQTLWGEGVVVVLPRELSLDIASGGERLASLHDIQVLGINVVVLWEVVVLLGDKDTLAEEVLVDLLAISLGNKPSNQLALLNCIGIFTSKKLLHLGGWALAGWL